MISKKRLSIIIPVYNASRHIISTLNSIEPQIDSLIDEVIIVDDCSTDGTLSLLDNFSKSKKSNFIFIHRTPINMGGPAGPRNIGVQNARGDFLAFCDADDIWHPKKLSYQLQFLDRFDVLASEKISFRDSHEKDLIFTEVENLLLQKISKASFYFGNPIVNSSVVCKREVLKGFRFNESIQYSAVEDYDLWVRLINSGKTFGKLPIPLVGYRLSIDQISRSKIMMFKKVFNMHCKNFGFFCAFWCMVFYTSKHLKRILFDSFLWSPGSKLVNK